MFEEVFANLLNKQTKEAGGQRREMLERNLTGTKKLLEVLYPVLGYSYFPYGLDELEQQPEERRKDFRALIGVNANLEGMGLLELPV
ncbi:hypothetical protein [Cohnella soli]|uniref:Uncharacterized protein n=1 Tax=Cohnella soli TaxID=425005 RepID=A0ABW0I2Y9_9BACL